MKGFKAKIRSKKWLRWLLIVSNWLVQGIIHLDRTEKVYRIFNTIFFSVLFFFYINFYLSMNLWMEVLLSFIVGHTINWLLNESIYTLLVHRLMTNKVKKEYLFDFLESFSKKINDKDWILYTASFGSICRGELKDTSDLDISIVRKPGFANALKGLLFVLKEKKRGDLNKIPLELYLNDKPETSKKRFSYENNPLVLYDPNNTVRNYYNKQITIEEAKQLNKIDQ